MHAQPMRDKVRSAPAANSSLPTMPLWSFHGAEFCLVTQAVDHGKSDYATSVPSYIPATQRLCRLIGTSQFIWCHTVPTSEHEERDRWILEVPTSEVWFVDGIVWNRLLGIQCALPHVLRIAWMDEAIRKFPDDPIQRGRYEEHLYKQFWDQLPPSGDWINHLLVEARADEYVSALVPLPVKREWVVHCPPQHRRVVLRNA